MGNILYADNIFERKSCRESYEQLVRTLGHTPFTATNGQEALEVICSQQLDILFLDWNMPVMNGQEVLQKLREMDSTLPVIICTGENYFDIDPLVKASGYEHVIAYCHLFKSTDLKSLNIKKDEQPQSTL